MDDRSTRRTPTVVLVGADRAVRRVVRLGLELDGAVVVEGDSVHEAFDRAQSGRHEVRGVVVDVDAGDGAVDEVRRSWPDARVIVLDDYAGTDPNSLGQRLNLTMTPRPPVIERVAHLVQDEAEELADSWRELCHWDPMLPPDSDPPMAVRMVRAVGEAMARPQPLGWGADPAVEGATEAFAAEIGSLDVAVGELVCLREAVRRRVGQTLGAGERDEAFDRLNMLIDRAIGVAASQAARKLEHDALVDPLTGLLNRRALDRDLRREFGRAARYAAGVTVVVIDIDGLKAVNDSEGHLAGDQYLLSLSRAFGSVLRSVDAAYRVGGDEFVVMLPDAGLDAAEVVVARALGAGAPPFSWGAATYPGDGDSVDSLLDLADRRLFEQRRRSGRSGRSGRSSRSERS
jgi:diguanylate cyclase (GGDEF)-like protein